MKIIQTELPLILEVDDSGEKLLYKWIISSGFAGDEKPKITSKLSIWDRLLCIPIIKKPLVNRTELVSPFYGKSYTELFKDDTKILFFPSNSHTYSEHFTQNNFYNITLQTGMQKFCNVTGLGIIADVLLSSDIGLYATLGGFAGFLSVVLNSGETEKKVFEKIVMDLETYEDGDKKINVDHVLNKMNQTTNDPENLKNAVLPDIQNKYGTGSVQFLEQSIKMKSAGGIITSDGVSADITAETPFFIKRGDFPFYTKATSYIICESKDKEIVLNGSIEAKDAQELYILVKSEDEASRLVDITDTLSTEMPDEFASGQYGEVLEFCGYVVDNVFFSELSDPFYQSHIKNSGFLLKAKIGSHSNLRQTDCDLDRIITDAEKTIACFEDISLKAEPAYFDGETLYQMNQT